MRPWLYLDWNSTTPLLESARQVMIAAQADSWANPASVHRAGRQARAVVERSRETLAAALGWSARELIFTSGGTEANNWALVGEEPLIVSALEHPSITRVAEAAAARGRQVVWLDVDPSGVIALASLERALQTVGAEALVCVMAVNHETGVVQPLDEVGRLVRTYRARLHVDAVQWFGKGPVEHLQVADTLSLAAHKIGGPKGIGALAFRGRPPKALLFGGAQERGLRPGTQDAVLAAGFGEAVKHAMGCANERLGPLRDALEVGLSRWARRNGEGQRLPHVSNVSFQRVPGPELVAALDLKGICVSSGSACSAGTLEPSSVIEAMLGRERAASAVRFSLGEETTLRDIEDVLQAVKDILDRS